MKTKQDSGKKKGLTLKDVLDDSAKIAYDKWKGQ